MFFLKNTKDGDDHSYFLGTTGMVNYINVILNIGPFFDHYSLMYYWIPFTGIAIPRYLWGIDSRNPVNTKIWAAQSPLVSPPYPRILHGFNQPWVVNIVLQGLRLVESTDAEPVDTEGQLYFIYYFYTDICK